MTVNNPYHIEKNFASSGKVYHEVYIGDEFIEMFKDEEAAKDYAFLLNWARTERQKIGSVPPEK